MVAIVVTRTTDYRSTALSNVTSVEFAAPNITATFDPDSINLTATWIGNASGPVNIRLASDVSSVFDARTWQFSSFGNAGNTITFFGSIHGDTFYGSTRKETIRGNEGDDNIYASGGGDTLHGGSGNDTFWFIEPDVTVRGDVLGDRGTGDRIILFNTGSYDFTPASVTGVEELSFNTLGEAILDTTQIGGRGKITRIDGSGGADSLIVRSDGSGVSLAALAFTDWHRSATIRIEDTASSEVLVGSARRDVFDRDVFEGSGGTDDMQGRGGGDIFELNDVVNGSIDGGIGTDRILTTAATTNLLNAAVTNVEVLELFDGGAISLTDEQLGTGGTRQGITKIIGGSGNELVSVSGAFIDLTGLVFENWDPTVDDLVLRGTSGNDLVAGSHYADHLHVSEGGDDISLGEGDDTFGINAEFGDGTIMDGGGGIDTLFVASPYTVDFRNARLIDVEELLINSEFTQLVRFSGDQIGGGSALQSVGLRGSEGRIVVTGSFADLSRLAIVDPGPSGQLAILRGTGQADDLTGSSLGDEFTGTGGADRLSGGAGIDSVDYSESGAAVTVSFAGDIAEGGDADGDIITGIENITGSAYDDRLTGDAEDNLLKGGNGDDTLTGGNGTDTLEGGNGDDVFSFSATAHSGFAAAADSIIDFKEGGDADSIRVSSIDANESTGADDAFTFIGTAAFTAAGQIRVVADGADALVLLNTEGSDDAEMEIRLFGVTPADVTSEDFIL